MRQPLATSTVSSVQGGTGDSTRAGHALEWDSTPVLAALGILQHEAPNAEVSSSSSGNAVDPPCASSSGGGPVRERDTAPAPWKPFSAVLLRSGPGTGKSCLCAALHDRLTAGQLIPSAASLMIAPEPAPPPESPRATQTVEGPVESFHPAKDSGPAASGGSEAGSGREVLPEVAAAVHFMRHDDERSRDPIVILMSIVLQLAKRWAGGLGPDFMYSKE